MQLRLLSMLTGLVFAGCATAPTGIDERVRKIEVGWGKLIGMCLAIQLFGGGLIAVLTLLKK